MDAVQTCTSNSIGASRSWSSNRRELSPNSLGIWQCLVCFQNSSLTKLGPFPGDTKAHWYHREGGGLNHKFEHFLSHVGLKGVGFLTRLCVRCDSSWILGAICRSLLRVPFGLHLITQGDPLKRALWETHFSTSLRWARQKGSPKQAPPEALRRTPDQSKISTLTRLALFAGFGQPRSGGPSGAPFFFTLRRISLKVRFREELFSGSHLGAI